MKTQANISANKGKTQLNSHQLNLFDNIYIERFEIKPEKSFNKLSSEPSCHIQEAKVISLHNWERDKENEFVNYILTNIPCL